MARTGTKTLSLFCFSKLIIVFFFILFSEHTYAQLTTIVPSSGGSWTFSNGNYGSLQFAPGYCYSVTIQAWGGGGGGINSSSGTGGAGGGFAQATVSITGSSSDVYYFASGGGGASNGGMGGSTWFNASPNVNMGSSGAFIMASGGGIAASYGSGSFGAGVTGISWHGGTGGNGAPHDGSNGGAGGGGAGPGIGGNGGNGGNGGMGNKTCVLVATCYYGAGGGGAGAGGATGSGANGANGGGNGNGVAGGAANGGGSGGGGGGGNTSCTSTSSPSGGGGGNPVGGGGGGGGGYCGSGHNGSSGGSGANGNGIIGGGGGAGGADLGNGGNGGLYGGGGGGGGTGGQGGGGVLIISVTGYPTPAATVNNSGPFCSGDVISVSASGSGGSGNYNYSWNSNAGGAWTATGTPATRSSATAAMSGAYSVTVTDVSSGCAVTASTNVVVNPAISVSATHSDASCASVYDGTISVSASGGSAPFQYSLNGGPTQSSATFTGVSEGTYTVGVRDNAGCTASTSVVVATTYTVSGTLDSTRDVGCFGGADGRAFVHMSGGVPPYQYSIDGLIYQPSGAFTGLTAGNYTISMKDSRGCTYYQAVTISQPGVITAILDSTVNGLCAGSSSAGIYISVSGGTMPYSYLWSNSAVSQDLTGISAGTYNVTVTDAHGCTGVTGATVSQPLPLYLSVAQYNNVYCNGDSSGAVDITVNGGTPPYRFAWSDGETTEDIYHLPASATAYSVTVTDTNGCQKILAQTITEPTPFVASVTTAGSACNATGANIALSGGVSPYSILWSNGNTTTTVANLAAGGYTVTATDANGCVRVGAVNIVAPLSLSVNVTNVTCNGGSNGAIDLTVTGGTPAYAYAWSDGGVTTEDRTALSQGTYFVTVTDNNACTAAASAVVSTPGPLNILLTATNPACNGSSIGQITGIVTGGTPNYSYNWSDASSAALPRNNVSTGNYALTITDANSCSASASVSIVAPAAMSVVLSKTDVACQGGNTGSVTATVTGGVSPYTYLWTAGNSPYTASQSNLGGGQYCVQVTDSNGCVANGCITVVGQQNPIYVTPSFKNPSCAESTDGFASVSVAGGQPPYAFAWSTTPAQTGNIATGLNAGSYTVTISDATGCSFTQSINLTSATAISVMASSANLVTCTNGADGIIVVDVTGGTAPYLYSLNTQTQVSDTFRNVSAGDYAISVRDANGCIGTATTSITNATGLLSVDLTANYTTALSGQAIQLTATAVSDSPIVSYTWRADSAIFDYSGCSDTTDCHNPVVHLTASGNVIVTAVDSKGCATSDTLYIQIKPKGPDTYFFPTAFTPNGDGLNDRFEFNVLGCTSANVQIWNRWGQKVYSNSNQANGFTGVDGWDGTYGGKKAQFDTYTYQIVLTFFDNHTETVAGTVTVME